MRSRAAGQDERVRVIVITANGDNFCAGADIIARNAPSETKPRVGSIQRRLPAQAHRLLPTLLTVQTPVVTAVRGWAAGIGFHVALASDFCVATESARFWEPFLARGFTPDSGGAWLLPRLAGVTAGARHGVARPRALRRGSGGVPADPPRRPRRRTRRRVRSPGPAARRHPHRRVRLGQVADVHRRVRCRSTSTSPTKRSRSSSRRAVRTSGKAWPRSARSAIPASPAAELTMPATNDIRLDEKVAIVTGGAGGIGAAYCRGSRPPARR